MSKKQIGKILKLFISTKENTSRTEKNSIEIDELGVIGDKFYNKNISRSILITSISSYELMYTDNIDMPFGYLGENLLLDLNPYSFSMGTKLQIGKALLEISAAPTICNHLSVIDERIPELLKNDRGIFAKVTKNGEIEVGDMVYLVE